MRFFSPDLTLQENLNNNMAILFIVGVALLILTFIIYLTEEEKEETKTILFYGVPVGIIAIVISLIFFIRRFLR